MGDLLSLFYLLTAAVWLYRSKRAFEALQQIPQVRPVSGPPSSGPKISILLPVKNEEDNLAACLETLLRQDYPSKEIIVINDHSLDGTPEILKAYAQKYPDQIKALDAPPLPEGWTGKNGALAHGVKFAAGEWFLFTDADTRHERWALSSAFAYADGKDLELITLTPRCLAEGFWEKLVQPAAMSFTGLWFPLHRVNDPKTSVTFGNGQFFFIKKQAYEMVGGHTKVYDAFLEDFAMVKEAKKAGRRFECAIGTKIYGTRMYRSFDGIWLGWRRIFYHGFEKKPVALVGKAISVAAFSFLPFFFFPMFTQIALKFPEAFGKIWGAAFPVLFLIIMTAWKTCKIVKGPRLYALLHPFAAFVLSGILWDAAWLAFQKKELKWR